MPDLQCLSSVTHSLERCEVEHGTIQLQKINCGLLTVVQWHQDTNILLSYHEYHEANYSNRLSVTDLHFKSYQCCQHQFTSFPLQLPFDRGIACRDEANKHFSLIRAATCNEGADTDMFYVARFLACCQHTTIFFAIIPVSVIDLLMRVFIMIIHNVRENGVMAPHISLCIKRRWVFSLTIEPL
jgi:hypothetical protein